MTFRQHDTIAGSGIAGERRFIVPTGTRLQFAGALGVELAVGGMNSALCVRGDDNIISHVTACLRGGMLEIGLADGAFEPRCELLVTGSWPVVSELHAVAGARVALHGLGGESVTLAASGANAIEAEGAARSWRLVSEAHAHLQLMAASR